jgi:hypothetical protein
MGLGITSALLLNDTVAFGGTGSSAVPSWALADLISDNKVNSNWNKGESSVRRGRLQTNEPTNLVLNLEGKVRKLVTDRAYQLLQLAHRTNAVLDILVLDGPLLTIGSNGYRFFGKVFDFGEDQGLQAVIFKEFSIEPSMEVPADYAGTPTIPAMAQVTGSLGALTYYPFG